MRAWSLGLGAAVSSAVLAVAACGDSTSTPTDTPDANLPSSDATVSDVALPSDDGGTDAGASDAGAGDADPDVEACVPFVADASIVDGEVLGLPTTTVTTLAPVATPQVAVTPSAEHYQKQVAVLNLSATVQDAQSVVHMLAPMGIPYAITTSPMLAVQAHDMAILFPEANAGSFDQTAQDLMNQSVSGGTLTVVMKYSEVAFLKTLGGIASTQFQLPHHFVDLTAAGKARFPSLDRPEEQHIPLGGDSVTFLNTWTLEVDADAGAGTTVLATFDDGKPAIVERQVGSGYVYTFGVDWRDIIQRNQLGRQLDASRGYINTFEPATDTWMLMMRDIYDARVRFGVRLATAPAGKRAALLLSHDLDWGESYNVAIQFALDEAAVKASSTFFVHTKYVTDSQDAAFFTPNREPSIETLLSLGGRVGSHTVAHSPVLHTFPVGDGTESYPTYAPTNVSLTETDGATLFGEMRVSKSLIDGALSVQCVDHETVSFRAGNLEYHVSAPQTLERLGYRFDSTRAQGEVLTNFPYRAMTDWPDGLDTSILEFPVTIEDQLAPRLDTRVTGPGGALDIIGANADNGAPTTILIHPNVLDFKENAEKAILAGLPSGVFATSIDEYAAFWRARDGVKMTLVNYDEIGKVLTVNLSAKEAIGGLTLRVASNVTSVISPASATLATGTGGNYVTLPAIAAGGMLTVKLGYL